MKTSVTTLVMFILFMDFGKVSSVWDLQNVNVPSTHVPYFRRNKAGEIGLCSNGACQDGESKNMPCWGYEDDCDLLNQFSKPYCVHHHQPWLVLVHNFDIQCHRLRKYSI